MHNTCGATTSLAKTAAQEALQRAECTGVLELPSELSYLQASLKCPLRSAPVDRLASAASTARLRQSGIYLPSAGASSLNRVEASSHTHTLMPSAFTDPYCMT